MSVPRLKFIYLPYVFVFPSRVNDDSLCPLIIHPPPFATAHVIYYETTPHCPESLLQWAWFMGADYETQEGHLKSYQHHVAVGGPCGGNWRASENKFYVQACFTNGESRSKNGDPALIPNVTWWHFSKSLQTQFNSFGKTLICLLAEIYDKIDTTLTCIK